ncbi:MAG: hypothetical protein R3E98_12505 [Gemmatimonadota bacterium]
MESTRSEVALAEARARLGDLAWGLLDDGDRPGAENMALDHALAATLPEGTAVLRLYGWARPTVSFGRHEPARERYRPLPDTDHVRRPTGGRAVLHRADLTYAVVFPAATGLRAAYRLVHAALGAGLARLGLDVTLAADRDVASPRSPGACFARPAGGELTTGGRKVLGSAQARIGRTILQHGSLLLVDDQSALAAAALGPVPAVEATTLERVLGRAPDPASLRRALVEGVQETLGVRLRPAEGAAAFEAARSLRARYASAAWTWDGVDGLARTL